MAFHVGDVWEPEATITKPGSETPVEPGSTAFVFKSPRGKETTGTPVKVTTGVWKSSQELTEAGQWTVAVSTTAPYQAEQPARIPVKEKWEP